MRGRRTAFIGTGFMARAMIGGIVGAGVRQPDEIVTVNPVDPEGAAAVTAEYGVIRGELNIRSRLDVQRFLDDVSSGKSTLLKNTTSGYHYHTVTADSEEILDLIQQALMDHGFLAPLTDYEPVNFWEEN